jgi:hypothetical protein
MAVFRETTRTEVAALGLAVLMTIIPLVPYAIN